MLLAPFTLSAVSARRCGHDRAAAPRVPAWLLAWAVGGFLAILLFPALRGGGTAGMSVPGAVMAQARGGDGVRWDKGV